MLASRDFEGNQSSAAAGRFRSSIAFPLRGISPEMMPLPLLLLLNPSFNTQIHARLSVSRLLHERTMRFSLKSVVSFVAPLLFSLSNVAWAEEAAVAEDFVMVVNAGTIEQAINDHSHLVVEFYAPCEL